MMRKSTRLGPIAAVLALVAMPALAQSFSEGFTFLKAVRERTVSRLRRRRNGVRSGDA